MKIITGVDELTPGLQTIMEQEGIPYRQVDWQEGLNPEDISCLVVFSQLTPAQREVVISYLTAGGAVLFSPEGYSSFCRKRFPRRKKKFLIAAEDSPF
ncbi:MAG: hypothetical protein JW784_06280, partial [Candidatus Cloacimonetes bacterium]|nr:hypothetical protein [Candidatus Cloacimonadota bacterium]